MEIIDFGASLQQKIDFIGTIAWDAIQNNRPDKVKKLSEELLKLCDNCEPDDKDEIIDKAKMLYFCSYAMIWKDIEKGLRK